MPDAKFIKPWHGSSGQEIQLHRSVYSTAFDVSRPTISHHLKVLYSAGLLECERRGTGVYCCWVISDALQQLSGILECDAGPAVTSPECVR
jgi:ArsR family transcriptional regulator, arsenate/arsenite/antimonite-responsive transcriptional repressor